MIWNVVAYLIGFIVGLIVWKIFRNGYSYYDTCDDAMFAFLTFLGFPIIVFVIFLVISIIKLWTLFVIALVVVVVVFIYGDDILDYIKERTCK